MKRIYDCEQLISIGTRGEFEHTSVWKHLHLLDEEQFLDCTNCTYYKTFEEFFEACSEGEIRNAMAYFGMFKTPKVEIRTPFSRIISKKNFPDEICVWNRAVEAGHYTIQTLMDELPADEFVEYLRERGISFSVEKTS